MRRSSLAIALCAAAVADATPHVALCFALADTAVAEDGGWLQLISAPNAQGKIQGRDGRWWRMSDPAAVAGRFDLAVAIDINHASELKARKGEDAPAYGWIEQLEVREGAIWGQVKWNDEGRQLVANRKYRFLSPVFTYNEQTNEIGRLTSMALVNDPNFALALNHAGAAIAAPTPENDTVDEEIRKALGLPEQATADQAVTAINSLRASSQAPALDKFVPRETYDIALNRANTAEQKLRDKDEAQQKVEIDAAVDGALKTGKITPATADYYRAQCATEGGLERFKSFIAVAPVIADASGLDGKDPDPATNGGKALNAATKSVAALMGVTDEDFKKYGEVG